MIEGKIKPETEYIARNGKIVKIIGCAGNGMWNGKPTGAKFCQLWWSNGIKDHLYDCIAEDDWELMAEKPANKILFKSERDVRRWVKSHKKTGIYWIEHGRGGSVGFPDLLARVNSEYLMPVELKCIEFLGNNKVKNPLRISQKAIFRQFLRDGVRCSIVVGEKNGYNIGVVDPKEAISKQELTLHKIEVFGDVLGCEF